MTNFTEVGKFMETFGQEVQTSPKIPKYATQMLRLSLILEEYTELEDAIAEGHMEGIADALTDILYVTYGAGHAFGIDLDKCFEEVQRSNMSKLGADGKPISAEEFLSNLFGALPAFFKSEDELRKIWSYPMTRKTLLEKLAEAGYGKDVLVTMQTLINAEKSDLFDVLEYVSYAVRPITRETRVQDAQSKIYALLDTKQKEFLEFVLSKYIETGVEELDQEKLPDLLTLKYNAISDATEVLGSVEAIRNTFIEFQKYLYERKTA